jgi:hypothetical protein
MRTRAASRLPRSDREPGKGVPDDLSTGFIRLLFKRILLGYSLE